MCIATIDKPDIAYYTCPPCKESITPQFGYNGVISGVSVVSGNINITINKITAFKLIGMQLFVTVLLTALFSVYISHETAYSALLGGIIFIVPNAYFVQCALRGKGHHPPDIILRWFYMGEAGKLILTGVLFAACFALVNNLFIPALFGTYILMLIINLVGLATIKN